MIMPNSLSAYSSKMSGAELKETVRNFVEGYQGGFIPFNRGSLPVVSGISVEIKETEDGYILKKVKKDGKTVQDKDTFTVTCLAIPKHMEAYPADDTVVFDGADTTVKNTATIKVTLVARPSTPSVKFTPFTVPITAKNSTGTANQPRFR